ncbi:hypothetical protein M3J09_009799 [Ascochyta lentis]
MTEAQRSVVRRGMGAMGVGLACLLPGRLFATRRRILLRALSNPAFEGNGPPHSASATTTQLEACTRTVLQAAPEGKGLQHVAVLGGPETRRLLAATALSRVGGWSFSAVCALCRPFASHTRCEALSLSRRERLDRRENSSWSAW